MKVMPNICMDWILMFSLIRVEKTNQIAAVRWTRLKVKFVSKNAFSSGREFEISPEIVIPRKIAAYAHARTIVVLFILCKQMIIQILFA